MAMVAHIAQHWALPTIALSYLISVTGSFCTIQLMEQWRLYDAPRMKQLLLIASSIALGGCGIWCTHFTGMNALELVLDDGTLLEINFEVGMTVISFLFPVCGVFMGLRIASTDPFFLEIEQSRRKELLVEGLAKTKMKDVVKKGQVAKRIKYMALFSRLERIVLGGVFAALGVLGMHYLGMYAQRTNAEMELHLGVVMVSCGIAFATANAAFWILFRAHTFWPNNDALRVASALVMGVAVCGTHYSGMASATYTHSQEKYGQPTTRYEVSGAKTSVVASHAALLLCYWMTSLGVTKSVKRTEQLRATTTHARDDRASHNNTSLAVAGGNKYAPTGNAAGRTKVYVAASPPPPAPQKNGEDHRSHTGTHDVNEDPVV